MTDKDVSSALDAMRHLGAVANSIAVHAADIAHARRVLYEAYLSEGFTEQQALELCKSISL